MNHYKPEANSKIVYCCVDNISTYESAWAQEITKNIADFTISNITGKNYSVLQDRSEDALLRTAVDKGYEHAVVFSTGTEFINGDSFFINIEKLSKQDLFLAGHILDRGEAYYELHPQCYLINLTTYKKLKCPDIGHQELDVSHTQMHPLRDGNNIHDDYTPRWIRPGMIKQEYRHQAHGWNILSIALSNKEKIIVFDEEIRRCKKHYYPESQKDFLKQIPWAYMRQNYCLTEFVHTSNNEHLKLDDTGFTQILAPASGTKFLQYISNEHVIVTLYDYNQRSIDYWKDNVPKLDNVTYKFLKIDLLTDELNLATILDPSLKTLINLSNIFCYEATAPFYNLEYRIHRENKLLQHIAECVPNAYVYFSTRACSGFYKTLNKGVGLELAQQILKPTWHE